MKWAAIVLIFFYISVSAQVDSFKPSKKNILSVGLTSTYMKDGKGVLWNGYDNGELNESLFALSYTRLLPRHFEVKLRYSYLQRFKQYDETVYPYLIYRKGRSIDLAVGYNIDYSLNTVKISLHGGIGYGRQKVTEAATVYFNTDSEEPKVRGIGDVGNTFNVYFHPSVILKKRIAIGCLFQYHHRFGFYNLSNFYSDYKIKSISNYTIIEPTIGFLF